MQFVSDLERRLARLRGSPDEIAWGIAAGICVAWTPTLGFQAPLAVGAATLVRGSRLAAVAATMVTNPLTAPFCYALTYGVGRAITGGPPVSEVVRRLTETSQRISELGPFDPATWAGLAGLNTQVWTALWIGGLVIGLANGALAWPAVRRGVFAAGEVIGRRRGRRVTRREDRERERHRRTAP